MPATYDLSTDRGKVRLIIGDTDTANALFQDEELDAFLGLEGGDVRLAAAQALDAMASSETMIQKAIRLMDLSTDGPAVARQLREHARELRRQVAEGSGDMEGLFDWAEMVTDRFSAGERLWKEFLREG